MSVCSDTTSTMLVQPATTTGCGTGGMGWGGDWSAWIIIFILFFAFGGWGNGFGGGNANGALTRGELCQDMNFSDLQSAVRSGVAENNANFRSIDNAVCTLGYQTAQLANGIQMQVANGFGTLDTSLCQLGNNIANQFHQGQITQLQGQNAIQSQLADCCCGVNRSIDGVNYNNAMLANATQGAIRDGFCQTNYNAASNTRDIIEAQNANARAILDKLTSQEIAAKDATIAAQSQQLFAAQLQASQCAQNAYLVDQLGQKCPQAAYLVCNPNAGLNYSVNYGGGCGCGCGV